MKIPLPSASFALRHGVCLGGMVTGLVLLWTAAYGAFFLLALILGDGIGSPGWYPLGLLGIALIRLVGSFVFMPACAVGSWACRAFQWPRLAAIPVVIVAAALWTSLISALLLWLRGELEISHWLSVSGKSLALFALPFGIYWWLLEGPGAIFELVRRLYQSRMGKRS